MNQSHPSIHLCYNSTWCDFTDIFHFLPSNMPRWRHQRKHFPRYWPFVRGIHRSRWIPLTKASDSELWWVFLSAPEQIVQQTIETRVIWDAIALIMTSPQYTAHALYAGNWSQCIYVRYLTSEFVFIVLHSLLYFVRVFGKKWTQEYRILNQTHSMKWCIFVFSWIGRESYFSRVI